MVHLLKVGGTVVASFVLLWHPVCVHHDQSYWGGARDVLARVFPVARGRPQQASKRMCQPVATFYISYIMLLFLLLCC